MSTRYLADYFSADEATGFTGRFFEQMIDQSDPYEFTPWDLAAVSTLSVEVPPIVAAKILLPGSNRDRVNGLLASLPGPSTELADATEEDIADDSPAAELYKFLRNFKDMGPTKSSKLLAAKRPRLVPIRDSVVERLLGAGERWWAPMRQLSRDERLRADRPSLGGTAGQRHLPPATRRRAVVIRVEQVARSERLYGRVDDRARERDQRGVEGRRALDAALRRTIRAGRIMLRTRQGRREWVASDFGRLVVLTGGLCDEHIEVVVSPRLIHAAGWLGADDGDDIQLTIGDGDELRDVEVVGSLGTMTLPSVVGAVHRRRQHSRTGQFGKRPNRHAAGPQPPTAGHHEFASPCRLGL